MASFSGGSWSQVRKCQNAVAFRLVMVKNGEGVEEKRLMPCSPGEDGCIEMSIMELMTNKEYGEPPAALCQERSGAAKGEAQQDSSSCLKEGDRACA